MNKIQACAGFKPMTFAIPVQCSTNWASKKTGSWLLCWFHHRHSLLKDTRVLTVTFFAIRLLPPCQTMYSHIPVDALSEADTNTFKSENWIFHLFTLACVRTLFTMYLFANGMFLRSTKVTCLEGSNIKELYCILLFIFFSFFFFEFQHWRQ